MAPETRRGDAVQRGHGKEPQERRRPVLAAAHLSKRGWTGSNEPQRRSGGKAPDIVEPVRLKLL
jgi:hypothetical protein